MVSKVLEPLHMASSIPWFLVLEALGHTKQVEPTLLIDLVKKTPEISDDFGRNSREMISLRILENLYNRGICNKNNHMPPPGSQIGLDPSDRCEDVLHRILHGASAENLKLGGPEILKWDIHSFIMQKRSRLPSSSLKKLKDGILEGSNPLLALLKDRSGLAFTNESQRRIPIDSGNSNGIAYKPEVSSTSIQNAEPNAKLDSLVTEKRDAVLQEISPDRNLLPAKRDRSAIIAESSEGKSHETRSTYARASKKLKLDLVHIPANGHEISAKRQRHAILGDSSSRNVEHIREEGREFEKEPQIRHMEVCGSGEDHHREDDASTRLTLNNDVSPEMIHCERQVPHSDSTVSGETSGERDVQNNGVDEAKEDNEGSLEPTTLNATDGGETKDDEENHVDEANNNLGGNFQQNAADGGETKDDDKHCNQPELSSDSDEYHDERIDIATRKNAFLSSQCTYSQESLATQLNLCVKCNKNGHLLDCRSNTCPLVVHESCLGSSANFDRSGNFYCPFCAYSRAISGYLEAKKKASLARKDLAAFIGLGIEQQLKKSSMKSQGSKQSQSRLDGKLHENNEATNNNHSLNEVNTLHRPPSILERQEVEPSRSCPCDNPPCGEKEADMTIEPQMTVCQSARGQGKEQPARPIVHKPNGDTSHRTDPETSHGSERPDRRSKQKPVSHQSESDPPHEPTCGGTDAEESSEEENEKAVTSKYSIRFRKQGKKNTYPATPQIRRKKLPWTNVEEETLKEGVQRFTGEHDSRNIPWKKILEFGGDVFLKGRTSIDLKDKWRNICKGSPRSK